MSNQAVVYCSFEGPAPEASRPKLHAFLPLVWELVRPRRGLLALGFVLMAINRVASLVLPYSTRYLIDTVIIKHNIQLAQAASARSIARDTSAGNHFLFADPIAFESCTAPDHGTSAKGAGPRRALAGRIP